MANAAQGRRWSTGTEHKIDNDLHNPAMLTRLGAMQGAAMLLGPFGVGITAFEFIHQSGGDLARVSAIEQIAKERTEPVHKKLLAALADKDAGGARGLGAGAGRLPRQCHIDGDLPAVCGQEVPGAADLGGGVPAHDRSAGATASSRCARGARPDSRAGCGCGLVALCTPPGVSSVKYSKYAS